MKTGAVPVGGATMPVTQGETTEGLKNSSTFFVLTIFINITENIYVKIL